MTKHLFFESSTITREDAHVLSIRGREEVSRLYEYEIDFLHPKSDLDFDTALTETAKIGIHQQDAAGSGFVTLWRHGILRDFQLIQQTSYGTHYRAMLVPRLWRRTLDLQSQIYLEKTVLEIIEAELKKGNFTSSDFEIKANSRTYPKREFTVQYVESDFAFISRLMEHEGLFYYFKHGDCDKLIIGDDPGHFGSVAEISGAGQAEFPYRPVAQAGTAGDVWLHADHVHALTLRQQPSPAVFSELDFNYRTPTAPMLGEEPATKPKAIFGSYYEYGSHYKTSDDGKVYAGIRRDEHESVRKYTTITGNLKSAQAGYTYKLKDHFRDDLNDKDHLLVRVDLDTRQPHEQWPNWNTHTYEVRATGILATEKFRPARITPKPKIAGFVNAIIDAGGSGEYAEIDDQGRYKVKLPLDRSDAGSGKASRFIRMAQPYAGGGMGFHCPLHKGTEVALCFCCGDPDRPIIMGALTNPDTASPVAGGNQTQCVLHTGGGNNITIEDSAGGQRIAMYSPKENSFITIGDAPA